MIAVESGCETARCVKHLKNSFVERMRRSEIWEAVQRKDSGRGCHAVNYESSLRV